MTEQKISKTDMAGGLAVVVATICGAIWLFYGAIIGAWLAEVSRLSLLFITAIGSLLIIGAGGLLAYWGVNGVLLTVKKVIAISFEFAFMREQLSMAQANTLYRHAESRLIDSEAATKQWQIMAISATKGAVLINNGVPTVIPPCVSPVPSQLALPGPMTDIMPHEKWFPIACESLHVIVLGESGSGKTTMAKAMAVKAGMAGKTFACDPHGRMKDWNGVTVIGAGRDYEAIDGFFKGIMAEMDKRYKAYEAGHDHFERITIFVDETTSIAKKCKLWDSFFADLSCEGRKVEMRLVILIHGKGVKTLKLEGQGDLRHNLQFVYLGKHAITQMSEAGAMGRPACMEINGVNCLIDTSILPQISTPQNQLPNMVNTEEAEQPNSQPIDGAKSEQPHDHDDSTILAELSNDNERVIAQLLLSGLADSAIAKHLKGNYDTNLQRVSKVKTRLNGRLAMVG